MRLINDLEKLKTPFTIILRTFGNDAQNVINELEKKTKIQFGNFAAFKDGCLTDNNKNILKTTNEILESIKPNQHGAWQDDYLHWHSHGETHTYGKPYPINLNSKDTVPIFFDDNATDKKILSVQVTSGNVSDQPMLQKKLTKLGRIVPVNTLRAILEEDYFQNCVDFALKQRVVSKDAVILDNTKVSGHSIFQPVTAMSEKTPLQQQIGSSFQRSLP